MFDNLLHRKNILSTYELKTIKMSYSMQSCFLPFCLNKVGVSSFLFLTVVQPRGTIVYVRT